MKKSEIIKIVYQSLLLILGFIVSPLWLILVVVWLLIGNYSILKNLPLKLDKIELRWFTMIFYLYPLLESIVKLMFKLEIINSNFVINRIEHLLFSFCLCFIILPIIKSIIDNKILIGLTLVGVVVIFGNLNAFWEFFLRNMMNLNDQAHFSRYYSDVMFDLMMNLIGSAIAGFSIVFLFSPKSKQNK